MGLWRSSRLPLLLTPFHFREAPSSDGASVGTQDSLGSLSEHQVQEFASKSLAFAVQDDGAVEATNAAAAEGGWESGPVSQGGLRRGSLRRAGRGSSRGASGGLVTVEIMGELSSASAHEENSGGGSSSEGAGGRVGKWTSVSNRVGSGAAARAGGPFSGILAAAAGFPGSSTSQRDSAQPRLAQRRSTNRGPVLQRKILQLYQVGK